MQQFMEDLGAKAELRVHTDSSAAQGICKRVGLGTQRHIAVNSLWVQERLRNKQFALFKVRGEDNPADLMTKHLTRDKMLHHLKFLGAEFREGRAQVAPQRKEDERIIGEDMDWQLTETVRNDIDDEEVGLRLVKECEECQEEHSHEGSDRGIEWLMSMDDECRLRCRGCWTSQRPRV